MAISFHKVRWKNILSTGNAFTEIQLDRSPNTLIIGSNGAGKSTVLDALCFGLFGKPFRDINKPRLINSINGSDGIVEIEFSVGKKHYNVIRGLKPNKFEIWLDGVMVDQSAKTKDYQDFLEKSILKFNYKSFTQIVILGSASFVPFMQLSPSDRRTIIEELLDIQIFTSMNEIIKNKMSEIKDNTMKNKYAIDLSHEKIEMQKQNIEDHKKHNDVEIEKKKQEVIDCEQQLEQLTKDIDLIQKHIDVLNHKISDKLAVDKRNKKLITIESQLETSYKKIEKDIEFYEHNDNCPTCKQILDTEFKNKQVTERSNKKSEVKKGLDEITKEIEKLQQRSAEITAINKHITEHNNEVVKHNSTITAVNKFIAKLQKDITDLSNHKDTLVEENKKLKLLKTELIKLQKEQESLSIDKHYHEYAASLLKDNGIKTKIIKQYLPIINKLINKYLKSMDFFVNFNLDENFEESIKSRHRDDFAYANFSEGEKQKIDISLLLTWRHISKLKNSTNTNLLILDEIFDSSLDAASVDMLMNVLKDVNDTNIFVISHKGDILFDRFRSIIKFEKRNNFSEITK